MQSRTQAIDFKKYMRHVLTAGGALLLVAAAGLDRAGPNGWPGGMTDPAQQVRALTR